MCILCMFARRGPFRVNMVTKFLAVVPKISHGSEIGSKIVVRLSLANPFGPGPQAVQLRLRMISMISLGQDSVFASQGY